VSTSEHLSPWVEDEHKTAPKACGCIWRHEEYDSKKHPRCNYRKNAHLYSIANEPHVYNVPSFRSPERWVDVWLDRLGQTVYEKSQKVEPGSAPVVLAQTNGVWNHAWDLTRGMNFQNWKIPYWHNTHHVIACGEITEAFNEDERRLLLKTRWNVNDNPNVIILPKQFAVARVLKLPTHVPPDDGAQHDRYSAEHG